MNQDDTINRLYSELTEWHSVSPIYELQIKSALQMAYGSGFDKGRTHQVGCKIISSYDKEGNKIQTFPSILAASRIMKCHKSTLTRAIRKRIFSKGFYWVIEH